MDGSPQKKQAFGSVFGASNGGSGPPLTTSFGQPSQPPVNGPFSFSPSNRGFGGASKPEGTAVSSSSAFGQPSHTQSSFTGFGQGTTAGPSQPPSFSFGQTTSAPPQTNPPQFSFGQGLSAPPSQAPSFSFGQSTVPQGQAPSFSFGQSAVSQSQAPSFSFGGSAPSVAQPQAPSIGFGQSTSVPGTQPPSFGFGQGNVSQSLAPPSFGFGSGQRATTQAAAPFGASSSTAVEKTTSATFSFGQSQAAGPSQPTAAPFSFDQSQKAPSGASVFGGFGAQKAEEPPQQPPSSFGMPPSTSEPAAPEPSQSAASTEAALSSAPPTSAAGATAFAAPFGQTAQSATATSEASTAQPAKAIFSFGAPQPSKDLFGPPASSSEAKAPASFSFGPKPATETATAVGVQASTSPAVESKPALSVSPTEPEQPSGQPVFNFSSTQPQSTGALFTPAQPGAPSGGGFSGFLGKPTADTATAQPQDLLAKAAPQEVEVSSAPQEVQKLETLQGQAPPVGPLDGRDKSKPAPALTQPPPEKIGQQPSFGHARTDTLVPSSKPTEPPQNAAGTPSGQGGESLFGLPAKPGLPTPSRKPNADHISAVGEVAKQPVYTKGPARVPNYLNGEGFKEYDRNYRLHSLNRELQRRIASLDPHTHDFENVIRHYVAAREAIGASIGLYLRNVAGMKRKGDSIEEPDVPSQYKRSRPISQAEPITNAHHFGPAQPPSQKTMPPFSATEMFKSMIPESTAKAESGAKPASPPQPSSNPFAAFAPVPTSSATLFGNTGKMDSHPAAVTSLSSGEIPAPVASTTPTKSPPKKPVFEIPKFGGGNVNFMNSFGQQAKASAHKLEKEVRAKRKAEEFDSDEDDEEAYEKNLEEEVRMKRAKIEAIPKGGFTPSFGLAATPPTTKPLFALGSTPSGDTQMPKPAPGSFDNNASRGPTQTPLFPFGSKPSGETGSLTQEHVNSGNHENDDTESAHENNHNDADQEAEDTDEASTNDESSTGEEIQEHTDDLPEDEVLEEEEEDDDDNDLQAAMNRPNPNKGKSLFERIEPNPERQGTSTPVNGEKKDGKAPDDSPIMQSAKNSTFPPSLWGSHIGKSTPETPSFSPITPGSGLTSSKEPYKPATTFNFTPTPPSTTPPSVTGASIFAGGLTKDGPVPGEGMFGSRPSTPNNADKPTTNIFASLGKSHPTSTPATDNTWKAGSPIKFGTPDKNQAAPAVNITAPSPSAPDDSSTPKPFGSLFGTNASTPKPAESSTSLGFTFGGPSSAPAPGFLGAASHLVPSVNSSAVSSRATSPGLTDNESVGTNETEEPSNEPQTSFMESRAGEENETCLWEARSKALKFITGEAAKGTKLKANDWNTMGLGVIRVLKSKDNGKTRIVFRTEPGASILVNSHLVPEMAYENVDQGKSGAVKGPLFSKGKLERWVFKVKTKDMAEELTKILEENKKA